MEQTPQSILKQIFGYDEFRPYQAEVIESVLQKQDALTVMPTGGGKSLCYQIPALLSPGVTVVISPLIALMKDQVEQLRAMGVDAIFLNSSLSAAAYQQGMAQVRSGKIKLLYLAPEALFTGRILNLLDSVSVDLLAIDEAHCISEWGHDFRPEYRQLADIRTHFPQAACLALTATATPRVRRDIQTSLGFAQDREYIASFDRENLMIEVVDKTNAMQQTLDFLQGFSKQSGIIYCFSRKQVDELSRLLIRKGFNARPYHAGLNAGERSANQEAFIRDDVDIIVATIAFGMGINKPDVRFVIHYDLPKSVESYYQEIGRAGRDSLPAHCLLLYSYSDTAKQRFFIDQKPDGEREIAQQHLKALTDYAESGDCRRKPLLSYFGETYANEKCGMCDNCRSVGQEQVDITIPAQKFISCVKRTGERFGAAHIAAVLTGGRGQKILKFGHDQVSTYGIGKDRSRDDWAQMARELVRQGLLSKDEHGGLQLTAAAYTVLRENTPIFGRAQVAVTAKRAGASAVAEHDAALFSILRQKRKQMADEGGVPPYVIFADRTLIEMAAYFPMSDARLLDIHGIGGTKLARYGETFIALIAKYCQENGLQEGSKPNMSAAHRTVTSARPRSTRHILYGEAYNDGLSLIELMDEFQVKQSTVIKHLTTFSIEGNTLRKSEDFWNAVEHSDELKQKAIEAFNRHGTQALRPVFDALNEQLDWNELRLIRLHVFGLKKMIN